MRTRRTFSAFEKRTMRRLYDAEWRICDIALTLGRQWHSVHMWLVRRPKELSAREKMIEFPRAEM